MNENQNLQVVSNAPISMFSSSDLFELVQRQAKLIASSNLIPTQFQNNVANCAIALEMASRLGASPFAVIQNLDVIHGRPSWRSVFLMGLVNNCGRFTPLQFKVQETGTPKTVDLTIEGWENKSKVSKPIKYTYTPTTCVAWARDKSTGDVVEGPPVSYDMAIQEGWVAKSGSKWLTEMRELMLRYRAASFFAKVYASDVMLGMQTSEEAHDSTEMRNVTPPADSIGEAIGTGSAASESPAPKPRVSRAPKTTAEVAAPTVEVEPVAPITEEKRGRLVAFGKFETRNGEKKKTQANPEGGTWKQWLLSYTEEGTEKSAATFSETMGATIEWLEPGAAIRIETDPNKDSRYADTLMFIEPDNAGGDE